MKMLRQYLESRLSFYRHSLSIFASSSKNFDILNSISSRSAPSSSSKNNSSSGSDGSDNPKTALYILDASFNPPTVAHMRMILYSGLLTRKSSTMLSQRRLLLLLATHNADKTPQPAALEHRLSMMEMMCTDLLHHTSDSEQGTLKIDLGVISKPYFVDKADTIELSGLYPPSIEHIYLIGFDTLTRIMNPQYYPPSYSLERLIPFLKKNQLLVLHRPGDEYGDKSEQDNFLADIANGSLDSVAGQREWVQEGRIKFYETDNHTATDGQVISSTKVRNVIRQEDEQLVKSILEKLLTPRVHEWIETYRLYS